MNVLTAQDVDVVSGATLADAMLEDGGAGAFVGSLGGGLPGAAIGALVGLAAGAILYEL